MPEVYLIIVTAIIIVLTFILNLSSDNKIKQRISSSFSKYSKLLKILIFSFSVIIFVVFIIIKIFFIHRYLDIIKEDNILENSESLFLFLSFVISVLISINFFRKRKIFLGISLIVIAFLFIIWSLEEISWFQRIYNLEIPKYFIDFNTQKEISIHNLLPIQKILHKLYIAVGFLAMFLWLIIPKKFRTNPNSITYYLIPTWYLMAYFFPVFAIYLFFELSDFLVLKTGLDYFNIGSNYIIIFRDQEPAEFMMSIGILILIMICLYKQHNNNLVLIKIN
jgi:hypothetical protein